MVRARRFETVDAAQRARFRSRLGLRDRRVREDGDRGGADAAAQLPQRHAADGPERRDGEPGRGRVRKSRRFDRAERKRRRFDRRRLLVVVFRASRRGRDAGQEAQVLAGRGEPLAQLRDGLRARPGRQGVAHHGHAETRAAGLEGDEKAQASRADERARAARRRGRRGSRRRDPKRKSARDPHVDVSAREAEEKESPFFRRGDEQTRPKQKRARRVPSRVSERGRFRRAGFVRRSASRRDGGVRDARHARARARRDASRRRVVPPQTRREPREGSVPRARRGAPRGRAVPQGGGPRDAPPRAYGRGRRLGNRAPEEAGLPDVREPARLEPRLEPLRQPPGLGGGPSEGRDVRRVRGEARGRLRGRDERRRDIQRRGRRRR